MIEYFFALILAGATAWFLRLFGLRSFERMIEAFAQLVGGWRGEGWPRGVQEEDRDRPWGRRVFAAAKRNGAAIAELRPTLTKVRPVVRPR